MMASKTTRRKPAANAAAQAALVRMAQQRLDGLATLESLDVLRGVPTEDLARLLDRGTFRAYMPGTTIFSETEPGEFLHFLLSGNVRLTLHDKDGHEVLLGVLGRGDCYGEGPLFGDLFRRAGVFAESLCMAVQFRLSDLRTLLPSTPGLNSALRKVYRRRLVESTLARVPLLGVLSSAERVALSNLLHPLHVARGEAIIVQGQPGEALYLIEVGQVTIEQNGQTIASIDDGSFFGEIALLSDQPHNATVRALTPTDLLVMPAVEFHRLLHQRPDIEMQLRSVVERRLANGVALRNDHDRSRRMGLAVNHGLLRGSHLLVRTPELCPPGCRICEQACAIRFGKTRVHLNGLQLAELDVLDACRQCRVGAECEEACPEEAFEWDDHGALVINDRCTGCGECVSACPYDAISRVPRDAHRREGPLWQLWESMQQRMRKTLQTIPLESVQQPSHRADKCDHCHDYADMACISACPTGSLRLVPIEELFPL